MSKSAKSTKESKQMAVSIAVLEIIERESLLAVTHSKVARRAGVSRAWIYEYIGKEKDALIEFAAEVFASHFARAKLADLPKTKSELEAYLDDSIDFLLDATKLSPVIIKLYYRFRGSSNPLGKVIQKHEKQWLDRSTRLLVEVLSMNSASASGLTELVLVLRMGFAHRLATAARPEEARKRSKEILTLIQSLLLAVG